jgi:NO-binding membrane sensor protein with MHYT domain
LDNEQISALLKKTQWSFATSMLSLLIAILLIAAGMTGQGTAGRTVGNICIYVFLISGIAFLVFLGMLVHRLGRRAVLWLVMVILFSPLAAIVAVIRVRQLVQARLRSGGQANESAASGS